MINKLAFILRIFIYAIGLLSIAYSFIVLSVHSGSKFYIVWSVLGIFLIFFGIALKFNLLILIPSWIRITFLSLVLIGIITSAIFIGKILSCYNCIPPDNLDYVIVLGAQVRNDGPSVVLNYRLERAYEYLVSNPETKCIVSGAQGSNEPCTEASSMKAYLVNRGISSDRIIEEDASTNTRENMKYSRILLPENVSVGIVTSNFHMYRSLYLSNKMGINDAKPIPAYSTRLYALNNISREVVAVIKDIIL